MSEQLHSYFYQIVHHDIRTGVVVGRDAAVSPDNLAELQRDVTVMALRHRAEADDGGWGDETTPQIVPVSTRSANILLAGAMEKMRLAR